ncbi:PKD domain-containing protein [Methanofollis aquaemaris]|uniref:PKD domain-containing protein n=1 Tax=Methanofollis aquaemaris TaxID=126734 RepID=A0A8A3S6N1_9EURY|nr:PKD domain-containing protein [Methanofollis aquaemaris]QSZ67798.1 PKD domain-containing protein [Methanofollis aquaemaris]
MMTPSTLSSSRRGLMTAVFFIALLLIPAASATSSWNVVVAADFPDNSICYLRSFAVDDEGHPHFCYEIGTPSYDGMNHTWREGSSWHTEAVPPPGGEIRGMSKIVHDSQGRPHLVCSVAEDTSLRYIHREENWVTKTIATGQEARPENLVLTLGPDGDPCITYTAMGGPLLCTFRNGTTWKTEAADPAGGTPLSVATDSQGKPGICYHNAGNALCYARVGEEEWETARVAIGPVQDATLLFDSHDRPGICFMATEPGTGEDQLTYARFEEGQWQTSVVASGFLPYDSSFLFDIQDRPMISYVGFEGETATLYHAWLEAGQWQKNVIDADRIGFATPLVLDGEGRPQICYMVGGGEEKNLQYARYDGDMWQTVTVATVEGFGLPALAVDSDGNPGIVFYDETNTALKYAVPLMGISADFSAAPPAGPAPLTVQFSDHSFTPPDTAPLVQWEWDFGDGSKGTGRNIDHTYKTPGTYTVGLTVRDGDGQAGTAKKTDLITVIAVEPLVNWTFDDVSTGERWTGSPCSLAVDRQGRPHLSFQKASSSPTLVEVMYAVLNRTTWETRSLANGTDLRDSISVALDGEGLAGVSHTVYYDGSEEGLYYYDIDGVLGRPDTEYHVYRFSTRESACAVDGTGSPCIAYTTELPDNMGTAVIYARHDGASWNSVAVETKERTDADGISLAFDPAGRPHLSYYRQSGDTKELVHAWLPQGSSSFENRTLEKVEVFDTSLAIDRNGNPHIAYTVNSPEGANAAAINPMLKYTHFDGTDWKITFLGTVDYDTVSLALDSAGNPHICYVAPEGLVHLWYEGPHWSQTTLEASAPDTFITAAALALDRSDIAHTCYGTVDTNTTAGTLWYAVNLPPRAGFTADTSAGVAPLTVRFNDTSTGFPNTWRWDFGDDTALSIDQHPTHEYAVHGWYAVNLTVQNRDAADTAEEPDYIAVFQAGHSYPFSLNGVLVGGGQTVTLNRTALAAPLNVSGNTTVVEGPNPSFTRIRFIFSSLTEAGGNVTGDLDYVLMNGVPVSIILPGGGTASIAVEINGSRYDQAASFDLLVSDGCSGSDLAAFSEAALAEGRSLDEICLTMLVDHTLSALNGAFITLTVPKEWVGAYGNENIRLFRRDDTGNVTVLPAAFVSENVTHTVFRVWTPGFSTFAAGALAPLTPPTVTPTTPTPSNDGGSDSWHSGSSDASAPCTEERDTPPAQPAVPEADGRAAEEAEVKSGESASVLSEAQPEGSNDVKPPESPSRTIMNTLSGAARAVQEGGARASGAVAGVKGPVPAAALMPEGTEPLGAVVLGVVAGALVATGIAGSATGSVFRRIGDTLRDLLGNLAEFFGEHIAEKLGEKEAEIAANKFGDTTGKNRHREILILSTGAVIYGLAFVLAERIGLVPGVIGVYILVCGVVVAVHEATHHLIARRFAMPSRVRFNASGIVTTFLTAWFFGNVFAQPLMTAVPAAEKRATGITMIAGPLVSFIFAVGFALLIPFGGIWTLMGTTGLSVNLIEAVYSLVPFTPMDGSSVYTWNRVNWAVAFVPVFVVYLALYLM